MIRAAVCFTLVLWQLAAPPPPVERFVEAALADERTAKAALAQIGVNWKDTYTAMFIDLARLMRPPRRGVPEAVESSVLVDDELGTPARARPLGDIAAIPDRGSPARRRLLAFLEQRTGQQFGDDLDAWREWMWKLPADPHPDYAVFKGIVYSQIDPRMRVFFPPGVRSAIRLDEIDWGGVPVNGIPPLWSPKRVPVPAAGYLKDSNVVFGLVVNGEARAYPKRILAWHEMAIDRIGDVDLTIVYCTLCGTVIPFESRVGDRLFRFGTSGLLYRSNKLMFDEDTNSLWSTFEGVPVVGSLVGSGLTLRPFPIVTTTWKEWRTEHPDTSVLSLDTGYKRDYSEGAAYRDYFATDRLMFPVSKTDARLPNKAEVLVMQLRRVATPDVRVPVAIDAQFLRKHPVYSFSEADSRFVVVTTERGANRVYQADETFPGQRAGSTIADIKGRGWRVTEAGLVLERDPTRLLPRVSAQRAFWFGWYAQFPGTILIK